MPLPEHTTRYVKGVLVTEGTPIIAPWALMHLMESLSDQETFELHNYADEEPSKYCERATAWLLDKGKMSL